MNSPRPDYLETVPPTQRMFPASWRDAAIRELYDEQLAGVRCPRCLKMFRTRGELRSLHCDHILPFSSGGPTTWENLQLLCGACNLEKSNRIGMA